MTDLITRLIAGPGSRELDDKIWRWVNDNGLTSSGGWEYDLRGPDPYTTSIDAAVAFAVAAVGAERALRILGQARDAVLGMREAKDALDALPRYIVAEVLKARGDD